MDRTLVTTGHRGASGTGSETQVPPPQAGGTGRRGRLTMEQAKEMSAVVTLKLHALEHPWLEREIVEEIHRLLDLGVPFSEIVPAIEDGIGRLDVTAKAAWDLMMQRREEMVRDSELRKTLVPRNRMEATLFAEMDKTDAMRAETAAMDDEFALEKAERRARIAAFNAEGDAAEDRTKAMINAHEKKVDLVRFSEKIRGFFLAIGNGLASTGMAISQVLFPLDRMEAGPLQAETGGWTKVECAGRRIDGKGASRWTWVLIGR